MLYEGQSSEICTKNKYLMECAREYVEAIKENKVDINKINSVRKKKRSVFNI